jgi:hypothetical protein
MSSVAEERAEEKIDKVLVWKRYPEKYTSATPMVAGRDFFVDEVLKDFHRARVAPVPLAPPSHLGLLYHGRALHPVLDVAALLGEPPGPPPRRALLLDAGGTAVAVAADRVLGPAEGDGGVLRPPWDAVLAP